MTSKILITGGTGFLGSALLKNPLFKDALIIGRTPTIEGGDFFKVSLDKSTDYTEILSGVEIIVHMAARAHIMDDIFEDNLEKYRNINTHATLNLAKQAAINGVKRFIFISSIKVLGEKTEGGRSFTNSCPLNPQDPYSISKSEAEIGLKELAKNTNIEVVIIRPPLIYGKGVKGNFARLLKLTKLSIPLPFGSIINKRSLVSVENIVSLISTCLTHPNAANEVFLVSDDYDMSTPELLKLIGKVGGYKNILFKCPTSLIRFLLTLIGKLGFYERLCGSMQLDITHTKNLLNWTPLFSPEDCMKNCWPKKITERKNR
jgi:UDP-glucose 4-epimerase